jgi:hypothetical protein
MKIEICVRCEGELDGEAVTLDRGLCVDCWAELEEEEGEMLKITYVQTNFRPSSLGA